MSGHLTQYNSDIFYHQMAVRRNIIARDSFSSKPCEVALENSDLWRQFHDIGTEMIITKSGRRMFPSMRLSLSNLDTDAYYCVLLELVPVGQSRFKYSGSRWVGAGGAEPQSPHRIAIHPDSPATGAHWTARPVLFNKVKLTNNTLDASGHVVLTSMHRYQPVVHVVRAQDPSHVAWGAPTKQFSFTETQFVAVTAYQNDGITKLKIDNNPFAKGFRETGQSRCKRKQKDEETQEDTSEIVAKRSCSLSDSSASSISSLDDSGLSSCSTSPVTEEIRYARRVEELNRSQRITPPFCPALPTVAEKTRVPALSTGHAVTHYDLLREHNLSFYDLSRISMSYASEQLARASYYSRYPVHRPHTAYTRCNLAPIMAVPTPVYPYYLSPVPVPMTIPTSQPMGLVDLSMKPKKNNFTIRAIMERS